MGVYIYTIPMVYKSTFTSLGGHNLVGKEHGTVVATEYISSRPHVLANPGNHGFDREIISLYGLNSGYLVKYCNLPRLMVIYEFYLVTSLGLKWDINYEWGFVSTYN